MKLMKKLYVSVIIPTYNRKEVVLQAIDSVYRQTFPIAEVIVIDDGSTDGTQLSIDEKFPQVTYISQENAGVSSARNRGINIANGEWIALLDSDDQWLQNKLEKQFKVLKDHPDMYFCHTDEIWIRHGKRVNQMNKHKKSGGYIFEQCLPLCCISPSASLIHRQVFEEFGQFDELLPVCEDYDFWLRYCSQAEVVYVDEPLIIKNGGHEDQLSRKLWGMDRFRIKALEKLIRSNVLNEQQLISTIAMLEKKVLVYNKGAEKRGKFAEVKYYESLLSSIKQPK